ncbi:MAG: ABC transporter ATP-binding protein [Carbonactinosporaceae bacterium]
MAEVTYDKATRTYPGQDRPAVDALELRIEDGEFLVLVGPSGCGKSTSLRMLAGLEDVDSGSIHIGEREVTHLPPKDRDIAMVFQNYALYPHMSVFDNMGFALKIANVNKEEIKRRVGDAAKLLDLEPYLDRKPKALSGGQRQRVAMGRAIVREPQVFLMDEPLSNLDAKLRVQTRTQIASLQRRLGVTTVYVTHDQVEAMTMGDRVAVLNDGLLQQVDTPRAMYDRPGNVFVAGFIGSPAMNLAEVAISDGGVRLGRAAIPLPREMVSAAQAEGSSAVMLGVRPESFDVADEGGIETTVNVVEELGADAFLYGTAAVGDSPHDIIARVDPRNPPAKGESVHLVPRPDKVHVFSVKTGERFSA